MSKALRVVQLIDSLNPGGSEKMAVQLANELSTQIELSALVCTRQSGRLESEISNNVLFFSLNKKNTFDIKSFKGLRTFIKSNKINIVHTHSTSFFWGTLLKLFCNDIKLIWHDHYGFRHTTKRFHNIALYFCSFYFNHIITVNYKLKKWARQNLKCTSVDYIPNFSRKPAHSIKSSSLILKGKPEDFKIIHVANLRPEKDHITALKAVKILVDKNLNVSYHSIGSFDEKSQYYKSIESFISEHELNQHVFLYGSQTDIFKLLNQADLGLLSSLSEGLPVSLIEYAKAELPVVVTDVGQCKIVVDEYGEVVDSKDYEAMARAIEKTILNKEQAITKANKLNCKVLEKYDSDSTIKKLIEIYNISLQDN